MSRFGLFVAKSRFESRSCFDFGFASTSAVANRRSTFSFRPAARPGFVWSPDFRGFAVLRQVTHASRFPRVLSRLAFSPARLVPSRRHPWGFSLQRFDLVLSPVAFRLNRALLFLGSPHLRRVSHSLRFAAVRMVCRVSCRLRLEIRRSVWLGVGSVPLSRSAFCKEPPSHALRFRETASRAVGLSRVAPVDFAKHAEMPKPFRCRHLVVPYDG